VGRGPSEDHLVGPRTDDTGDDLPRLVKCLRGQPTRAVESHRITPPGLLRIQPSLARSRQHRLAR
jgi:hypothetical protein